MPQKRGRSELESPLGWLKNIRPRPDTFSSTVPSIEIPSVVPYYVSTVLSHGVMMLARCRHNVE